jgi:hypothetical protein
MALEWKPIRQNDHGVVQKEANVDGFWAEFERADGKTRVHITAQDLMDFGAAPKDDKATHTERVLRTILEQYCQKVGDPPAEINAKDLSMFGLAALKSEFRKKPDEEKEIPSDP